jgi:DNA-binding MarR family transcriptional regulator
MAGSKAVTSRGPSLLYAVKQVELAVRALMDETLRPLGVTTIQYTALTVLERRSGLTSAALARRSFVTAQTMNDIVMTLERRGYIERQVDPTHARRLTISLTDQGRQLLDEVRDDIRLIEERMAKGLSDHQRESLRQSLRICVDNLIEHQPSDHP